ncbi:putative To mCG8836 isoform 1 protein, partial [Naja naja]
FLEAISEKGLSLEMHLGNGEFKSRLTLFPAFPPRLPRKPGGTADRDMAQPAAVARRQLATPPNFFSKDSCFHSFASPKQLEVSQLEGSLQQPKAQCVMSPYLVPDTQALCQHLSPIRQLAASGRFIVIIPRT